MLRRHSHLDAPARSSRNLPTILVFIAIVAIVGGLVGMSFQKQEDDLPTAARVFLQPVFVTDGTGNTKQVTNDVARVDAQRLEAWLDRSGYAAAVRVTKVGRLIAFDIKSHESIPSEFLAVAGSRGRFEVRVAAGRAKCAQADEKIDDSRQRDGLVLRPMPGLKSLTDCVRIGARVATVTPDALPVCDDRAGQVSSSSCKLTFSGDDLAPVRSYARAHPQQALALVLDNWVLGVQRGSVLATHLGFTNGGAALYSADFPVGTMTLASSRALRGIVRNGPLTVPFAAGS